MNPRFRICKVQKKLCKGIFSYTERCGSTLDCGSQVRSGRRQSMPSNNMDSCAPVSATVPLVAFGHTKRPRSRRLSLTSKCTCFDHSDTSCAHHSSVPPVQRTAAGLCGRAVQPLWDETAAAG